MFLVDVFANLQCAPTSGISGSNGRYMCSLAYILSNGFLKTFTFPLANLMTCSYYLSFMKWGIISLLKFYPCRKGCSDTTSLHSFAAKLLLECLEIFSAEVHVQVICLVFLKSRIICISHWLIRIYYIFQIWVNCCIYTVVCDKCYDWLSRKQQQKKPCSHGINTPQFSLWCFEHRPGKNWYKFFQHSIGYEHYTWLFQARNLFFSFYWWCPF